MYEDLRASGEFKTDFVCPNCGAPLIQRKNPSSVYGCTNTINCGLVWKLDHTTGELISAIS